MTDYSHYVSLDLETTGLDPSSCDITEIAMIKVRNGEIVDRMETFVYTPLEISQHISYLTGITAKDLENAPDFVQLIPKIEEFIGSDPLMGHNIWFDWNFLTEKGVKIPDSALWDTYLMSNILYPELPSHSLETNSKYFGIHHVDSHRAMADVMACYELWKILIDTFPDLTDEQKEQIRKLSQKTSWPLMSYFLQDKTAHRHVLDVPETFLYHPHELSSLDVRDRNEHLFIHDRGQDPVDRALSIKTQSRTLYVAGYQHTLDKLQKAFPDAIRLHPPYAYLSELRKQELLGKKELQHAEAMLLLKTILYPYKSSQEELVLSHPERSVWREVQTTDEESLLPENPYQKAYQVTLKADRVISSHFQILTDLDYLSHFNQLVILEPQLLEGNATRSFGKGLYLDQWLQQSNDSQWKKKGEYLFALVDQLGKRIAPASPYPEHLILTDTIIQSNEFTQMKSGIKEVTDETQDPDLSSYLKYFQAFFHPSDASWIRWISVDPKRGVSLHVAPMSVKVLLDKHVFQKASSVIISNTADYYPVLPEMERMEIASEQQISIIRPDLDLITGSKKDGDQEAMISYLSDQIPLQKGKTAVIFSSKTVLKRYFFDLVKVIPDTIAMLGEDISGGSGKLQDRYLTVEQENKVLFMTYRSLRNYPLEVLDFDQIFLQCLPFDPPGFPVHQARSEQYSNAFADYAMPMTQQNLLEIVSNFTHREGEKKLYVLDRRVQEKSYGEEIIGILSDQD